MANPMATLMALRDKMAAKKKGPMGPPEGSSAEEAMESPAEEKKEQKKGKGDRPYPVKKGSK